MAVVMVLLLEQMEDLAEAEEPMVELEQQTPVVTEHLVKVTMVALLTMITMAEAAAVKAL